MKRKTTIIALILIGLWLISTTFGYSQTIHEYPTEEIPVNKLNADSRIVLHYGYEGILAMDSIDFEIAKYYLTESYAIDTMHAPGFDAVNFDITRYEKYRSDSIYNTHMLLSGGAQLVFIPRDRMVYRVKPCFRYTFTIYNVQTTSISKSVYNALTKIFTKDVADYSHKMTTFTFESTKNVSEIFFSESMSDVGYVVKEFNKTLILTQL
jgi:hypothetical protein